MPVSVTVEVEERLAYAHSTGSVSLAETVEAIVAVAGSADFQPHFGVLVDLRKMESAPGVSEVIEIVSALDNVKRLVPGRIALVAENVAHFRLAQLASALARAAGLNQRAFRDIDGARAWLGPA
jgi:2C-methyl-D-erythritol 2,4-cyclodiphosphate synthase